MPPYNLLPLRSQEPSTDSYLDKRLQAYEICRGNGCYDEAYVNAHLIFIYWLYCKLWLVTKHEPDLVTHIFTLHSFDSNFKLSKFLNSSSALSLHQLKLEEKKYSEVFGRLCLDKWEVSKLKGLVDQRNNILHPSGVIVCADEYELDELLDIQNELSVKIANSMCSRYSYLLKPTYSKELTYRRLLRWEQDLDLERELFAKYQLSQMDLNILSTSLKQKTRTIVL